MQVMSIEALNSFRQSARANRVGWEDVEKCEKMMEQVIVLYHDVATVYVQKSQWTHKAPPLQDLHERCTQLENELVTMYQSTQDMSTTAQKIIASHLRSQCSVLRACSAYILWAKNIQ